MSLNLVDDYFIVKVDNQSNINLVNIHQQDDPVNGSSIDCGQFIDFIRGQLKVWIDSLGIQSAEAQNLKEPITCHTRFIQGSFRSNSPHKHKDSIYFLVKTIYNQQPPTIPRNPVLRSAEYNRTQLIPVGLIRVGTRNLFLQYEDQLVNMNRCFSILDFYVTHQRQGLGKLLISTVLTNQSINITKCAFDRPTQAMLSFLEKHFALGSPHKQHNRFVIYDGFFS